LWIKDCTSGGLEEELPGLFRILAMGSVFFFSTSRLGIGDLECEREVGGDGEGVLLLEWLVDLDLLSIHSHGPPSSAKYVEGSKIIASTRGITTRSINWDKSFSVWNSGYDWG